MSEEKTNTDAAALRPMSCKDLVGVGSSEVGFAGTLFLSLLELFRSLKNSIDKNASWSAHDVVAFREELESYLLWGAHYGTTVGKLDRILETSSRELRDAALSYIGNIGQILWSTVLLKPSGDKWLEDQCRKISRLLLNLDDLGVELDKGFSDEDSTSYMVEDLKSNIDLLHEIVPALDDVASDLAHSEVLDVERLGTTEKEGSILSGPSTYYQRIIMDKFPSLDVQLAERLAYACWFSHNRLRADLGKAKHGDLASPASHETSSIIHDSGFDTTVGSELVPNYSQASYQYLMSCQMDAQGGTTGLPPLPSEVSLGQPFICSICRILIRNVKNESQWEQHVFRDLRPYACIIAECEDRRQFTSRGDFAAHVAKEHQTITIWSCLECGNMSTSYLKFRDHLESKHYGIPKTHILEYSSSRDLEEIDCPFCGHLPAAEEISLSIFPQESQSESNVPEMGWTTKGSNVPGDTQPVLTAHKGKQVLPRNACDSCRRLNLVCDATDAASCSRCLDSKRKCSTRNPIAQQVELLERELLKTGQKVWRLRGSLGATTKSSLEEVEKTSHIIHPQRLPSSTEMDSLPFPDPFDRSIASRSFASQYWFKIDKSDPGVALMALQTQKRALAQHRKLSGCIHCRVRKIRCDATNISGCSNCLRLDKICLPTKITSERLPSLEDVKDLERQLSRYRQDLSQLQSQTSQDTPTSLKEGLITRPAFQNENIPRTEIPCKPSQEDHQKNIVSGIHVSSIASGHLKPELKQIPPPQATTSYWTASEQENYENLVGIYGHHWQQISRILKTKTPIMIQFHFYGELEKGNMKLERRANAADRARGMTLEQCNECAKCLVHRDFIEHQKTH
ncbi:hypothetical protein MMC27_005578 [Xylographa pallens]|nr:hypothetical protein [Xylographa pallens]